MAFVINDVAKLNPINDHKFLRDEHIEYIANHGKDKNDFEYSMTEFLRMSGVYWCTTALDLLDQIQKLDRNGIIEFIKNCQDPISGGIAPCEGHDPHILYTLSAVQILLTYDCLDEIDVEAVARYVAGLQQPDGSFFGDKWGEIDTRFSFCAVAILSLIHRLNVINLEKSIEFVMSCCNADGGFGSKPNAESHAGLIYCCVGFLSITNQLHRIDTEKLCWWLCERQLPSGGLNGRPEKLPDVCYSWWVVASLKMMGRLHWVNDLGLKTFIYSCQDEETGGFSDRIGNLPDVFHTLFGLGALSLMGLCELKPINPTYCMPQHILDKHNIKSQILHY